MLGLGSDGSRSCRGCVWGAGGCSPELKAGSGLGSPKRGAEEEDPSIALQVMLLLVQSRTGLCGRRAHCWLMLSFSSTNTLCSEQEDT